MKLYKVWVFPVYSTEVYAESEEKAQEMVAAMDLSDIEEHTDACDIVAEESEEVENV